MYRLTDPSLRKVMLQEKIFCNRYQTAYDRQIFRLCQTLKKEKHVQYAFVDKNHLTTMVRAEGESPVAVYDFESFPALFTGNDAALTIIAEHRESAVVLNEDDEASTHGSKIIDVE